MRISLKVLGLLWLGLFLIIGALLFNAYSKFKPETFIALLTEQVQKNYPGAKLNVEKVSYRFSLDFNLNLQNIHLRRSGKLLGSIGELELKVPWWLLLVQRGNAHINLKNLDIYVDHKEMETPAPVQPNKKSSDDLIRVSLPSYLSEAKYTLRAQNITIRDIHNSRRYFVLSKLLVREFQYGKNSAFELNIPISITQNENQYMSDLWLFGDITPEPQKWSLNFRGEFRTRENSDKFRIEDVVIGGQGTFIPSNLKFDTNINLEIDKQRIGLGQFKASQEDIQGKVTFEKLPISYLEFIYEVIQNPYLQELEGQSKGSIEFSKAFESSSASFSGSLSFDGNFLVSDRFSVPGQWQFDFQNNRWEVSFISPKGEVSFFRRSFLDLKKYKVTQYSEELGFSALPVVDTINTVRAIPDFILVDAPNFYTTTVSFKNCTFKDSTINGNFKYGLSPLQKFYQGTLTTGDSEYKIEFSRKSLQNNLNMDFKKFVWDPSFQFLLPVLSANAGTFDGKIEGRWNDNWENGKWLMQLGMSKLEGPAGKLSEFINKSFSYFNVQPEKFPEQKLNLIGNDQLFSIKSLMLEGQDIVKLTGQLSTKQKSFLTISYPKKKNFSPFRKEVLEPYWIQKEIKP